MLKLALRTIRSFKGRYMAILLIVALSAGFFAGLKITRDSMVNTADIFFDETNFYDFRAFSTVGFTEKEVNELLSMPEIKDAEGTKSWDVSINMGEKSQPVKVMSIPERVNVPILSHGRMPQSSGECLAENDRYSAEDIGKVLKCDPNDVLKENEYTIVGLVDSPLYISIDRGSTSIGGGSLHSFIYIPDEGFKHDIYTEVSVTLEKEGNDKIYTGEYNALVDSFEKTFADKVEVLSKNRMADLTKSYFEGTLPESILSSFKEVPKLQTYVLTRNENSGYVSFENDTAIVSGVANIFPVFFILIALLVCMTTMSRMVVEERTQIGTLKSMGYGNGRIISKYLIYSGSATVVGWCVGFFLCTWGLPQVFWLAYGALYGFTHLRYLFDLPLAVVTLVVSLAGILGSTYLSCRKSLAEKPASLIRPRTAKVGKRTLIERITPLWKRLSFLDKITVKNMFRYKQRMFMMLLGISWCAGLVVTGFGVRDSILDIAETQFENIQKYNIELTIDPSSEKNVCRKLDSIDGVEKYISATTLRVDIEGETAMNLVNLVAFKNNEDVEGFWEFSSEGESLSLPQKGEALINNRMAEKLDVSVGDTFTVKTSEMKTFQLKVGGIFKNHIYNYIIITEDTYESAFGEYDPNILYLHTEEDTEETTEKLIQIEGVSTAYRLSSTQEIINDGLQCLDYIVLVVVIFSGALSFVVIFNLTNINIAERTREIATVRVLGFYPHETASYVLRENLVLAFIAAIIGMPFGMLFHKAVMGMILIDAFSFNVVIKPISYVFGFVITVLFAFFVNLFMKKRVNSIKMAESLKAVE